MEASIAANVCYAKIAPTVQQFRSEI